MNCFCDKQGKDEIFGEMCKFADEMMECIKIDGDMKQIHDHGCDLCGKITGGCTDLQGIGKDKTDIDKYDQPQPLLFHQSTPFELML